MSRKRLSVIFIALLLSIVCISASAVQSEDEYVQATEDALRDVPSQLRNRLVERLNLYVESISKENFDQTFDLMPEDCRNRLTKDDWLSKVHYEGPGQIQKFIVKKAFIGDWHPLKLHYGEKWSIDGCTTYKKGQEEFSYQTSYKALLLGDEWYFCGGGISIEGPNNEYIKCSD